MAESKLTESALLVRTIVEECLRKLEILECCTKNAKLYDCSGTYSIAELLHHKRLGLQSIVLELTENPKQLPSSVTSLSTLGSSIPVDESASGEDRIYYDRFEFLDKCKVIQRLAKRLEMLQFQCHEWNHKLHEESQIEMTKQRFVMLWELARKEQLQKSISLRVQDLQQEQTIADRSRTNAIRAALKIDEYYDWKLANIEQSIEDWMTRFDREKEEQDSRFQKARATEKLWNELLQLHEQQAQEIVDLEKDLERWEEDAKFKEYCHRMATKLQAWWRGTMVRKGFGRFDTTGKRNKGKKSKAKGKNSKKGKK
ncbi:dynein regulatory complex protein 9-like [Anopheles maculipalpis]|uniref:dynein regulatory complex protein 9-like n=1 Tax=Anopheles maculipalpis TaxID=1496333 RepID=UPI002159712F|nr:dynein regulatory complex protein 9-like [Anopheles maculipalpis]